MNNFIITHYIVLGDGIFYISHYIVVDNAKMPKIDKKIKRNSTIIFILLNRSVGIFCTDRFVFAALSASEGDANFGCEIFPQL